jgi:hypothetical protein
MVMSCCVCYALLTHFVRTGDHEDNLWGDINAVNSVPWPVLDVQATWNRFRILGDHDMPLALVQHHDVQPAWLCCASVA